MAARTGAQPVARRRKTSKPWVRFLKRSAVLILTFTFVGFIVAAFVFAGAYKQAEQKLSNLGVLMEKLELQPTTFYSADGKVLYVVSNQDRRPIKYAEIPKVVKDAVIAAEDKRFWKHHGVDPEALAAIAADAMKDRRLRGGSTLSMQLAKRLYTSNERTFQRKVNDMALAVAMERRLTKEQILEMYLNEVFFGSGAYGIKAAADTYFAKSPDKLTVAEAAMLARCVRRPTEENPFRNLKKATENRNLVLRLMHQEGMINDEQLEKALNEKPRLNPKPPVTTARILRAPYFVRHVEQVLKQDMPDIDFEQGGYKIYTTLDSAVQAAAEKAVRQTVEKYKGNNVSTGACVIMDTKGRILAEVGGVDYRKNEFNVVTQGRRQPGSSFKTIVYATAFAQGAADVNGSVSNAKIYRVDPWTGQVWAPKNSSEKYGSVVSVRTAFAGSVNRPAIHLLEKVGATTVVDYAKNVFGIESRLPAVSPLAIGAGEVAPIEMAEAISVFATGGDRAEPYPISRIMAPDGTILRAYQPRITSNVLQRSVVEDMDSLMRLVVTGGTGRAASVIPEARGKTGTTNANKDAWFVGYSDGIIGISWVGNEQRINGIPTYLPMGRKVFGGTVAVQIWNGAMKAAYPRYAVKLSKPDEEFVQEERGADEETEAQERETQATAPTTTEAQTPQSPTDPSEPPDTDTETDNNEDSPGDMPSDEPTERPRPRPKPEPPPVQYVDVEICADSRKIAGMYCPETVVRTYVLGQQPTTRCTVHGPR